MKTYRIKHVDAFTTEPFCGNPAGVVLDARGLSDATMQQIAREMNLSETAFLLPPTLRSADLQIRWFTPAAEVPLCGHATIAYTIWPVASHETCRTAVGSVVHASDSVRTLSCPL